MVRRAILTLVATLLLGAAAAACGPSTSTEAPLATSAPSEAPLPSDSAAPADSSAPVDSAAPSASQ